MAQTSEAIGPERRNRLDLPSNTSGQEYQKKMRMKTNHGANKQMEGMQRQETKGVRNQCINQKLPRHFDALAVVLSSCSLYIY